MNKFLLYCTSILLLSFITIHICGVHPLSTAVQTNNTPQIQQILKSKRCSQKDKNHALLIASKMPIPKQYTKNVRLHIMSILLTHGAQIDYSTTEKKTGLSGGSALFFAVKEGCLEKAQFLLQHDANPNWKNRRGYTPLTIACIKGNIPMAILLCQHGALLNKKTDTGPTPLIFSAMRKYSALTNELLLRGAWLFPDQKIRRYAKAFIEERSERAEQQRLSCLKEVLQTDNNLYDDLIRLVFVFDGTSHLWHKYKLLK